MIHVLIPRFFTGKWYTTSPATFYPQTQSRFALSALFILLCSTPATPVPYLSAKYYPNITHHIIPKQHPTFFGFATLYLTSRAPFYSQTVCGPHLSHLHHCSTPVTSVHQGWVPCYNTPISSSPHLSAK